MPYPSRCIKYLALLATSVALVAPTTGAQTQEQKVATKFNLEPTRQTLDLEAGNAKKFPNIRPERQLPGRSYEAYARLPFQKNLTRLKYRVSSTGEAVFEGDMILGDAEEVQRRSIEYERLQNDPSGSKMPIAVAILDAAFLWTGGVVPYRISAEFGKKMVSAIKDAVNELNTRTNIRMIPYDQKVHKDYVDIVVMEEKEPGCGQSAVGRQGQRQKLYLKADTDCTRTALHELVHALGFAHEHTRADRDKFVEIRWRNIIDEEEGNFQIHNGEFAFDNYDYDSIMHYDGFGFSRPCDITRFSSGQKCGLCATLQDWRNAGGRCLPTIVHRKTKDPIAASTSLSTQDVAAINALYPKEERGSTLPPVSQLRSLRTTIERVITRAGPNEVGLCSKSMDYLAQIKAGPAVSFRGAYDNRFDPDRFNVWETDKPERSDDFRPGNWRLVTPVSPNTGLIRVDVSVYDHDPYVYGQDKVGCDGQEDVVDVNPTRFALLRLLVDTSNGDVSHLGIEDSPLPDLKTYPVISRIGSIFNGTTGQFITLKFNGLLDGNTDYAHEAEIHLKIEVLS